MGWGYGRLGSVMAGSIRGLLVQSNKKLGGSVFHFDLPPGLTCPGETSICSRLCYAKASRYAFPQVKERLAYNYAMSKRREFAPRLVSELYRKGVILMRFHVAGDIYSPAYARKMLAVVKASPQVAFWVYTRSYRIPAIAEVLWELAGCDNLSLWLSTDDETGYPPHVPQGVRVAHMQTDEPPAKADLVFATKEARKHPEKINLDTLCVTETAEGKLAGTTCSTCRLCVRLEL